MADGHHRLGVPGDGTELRLISGIDDHSRFCVIATVVRRATARAICRAFIAAMRSYGIPDPARDRGGRRRYARNQVSSAIEDRDFSRVLDLHERLGRDAAAETVVDQ